MSNKIDTKDLTRDELTVTVNAFAENLPSNYVTKFNTVTEAVKE